MIALSSSWPQSIAAAWVLLACSAASAQTSLPADRTNTPADEQRIHAALEQRGSLDVSEMPLRDVVEQLGKSFDVSFLIVDKKLEEAAVSPTIPVTAKIDDLPLESLLHVLLEPVGLDFAVADNLIRISTPDDLNSPDRLETRVYPVRDLLLQDDFGDDAEPLIEVITTAIRPESWDEVGGAGSIGYLESAGTLAITQNWREHRKIERLLETFREARTLSEPPADVPRSSARKRVPVGIQRSATRRVAGDLAESSATPQSPVAPSRTNSAVCD